MIEKALRIPMLKLILLLGCEYCAVFYAPAYQMCPMLVSEVKHNLVAVDPVVCR